MCVETRLFFYAIAETVAGVTVRVAVVSRPRVSIKILSHFYGTYIIPPSTVGPDRHIASAATTLTSGFR